MNTTIPGTDVAVQAKSRAEKALAFIDAFAINDDGDYELAGEELRGIKSRWDTVEAERVKITQPLNAALKAANDLFRAPLDLFKSAESKLKAKMIGYSTAQAQKAEAARREAERLAAEERRRLEALAEEQAQQGHQEAAQATLLAAEVVVAAPLAVAPPKAAGVSVVKSLGYEVQDLGAFIEFVAKNRDRQPELVAYLDLNGVKMNAMVKAVGKNLSFPGILVVDRQTMRAR